MLRILLAMLMSLASAQSLAWGTHGHHVVANLAYAQLTPKVRAEVDRLLALEPGATLASVSTWADETRNRTTAPWHYVNFPRDSCTYDAKRDCPDGQCIVQAINKQLAILESNVPNEKRLIALKYVVHLVADAHQPLHAGYADDRGGNTYQIQVFGRGTNLHALWDSGLIESMGLSAAALKTKLMATPVDAGKPDAAHITEESCRIVGMAGFYPGHKVGVDYRERYAPLLKRQLAIAGKRLAELLNGAVE